MNSRSNCLFIKMARVIFYITLTFFAFFVSEAVVLLKNSHTKVGEDVTAFDENSDDLYRAYSHRDNKIEDAMLRFYNGKTTNEFIEVRFREAVKVLKNPAFRKDQTTVFYIHGYKETPDVESVQTVVKSYLDNQPNTNVVLIDWSNMAFGSYFVNAAPNTKKVANTMAKELAELFKLGLNRDKVHIVGHSLGGQTAGFIGKEIKRGGKQLKRITALDPAFPMFYPGFVLDHISKDDAEVVDVIHTDAGFYGAPEATGTVDFWPNRGKRVQPGCAPGVHLPMTPEDLCNHWMSWRLWADSLANPKSFPAGSRSGKTIYMGVDVDLTAKGSYYLITKDKIPYGMGTAGAVNN